MLLPQGGCPQCCSSCVQVLSITPTVRKNSTSSFPSPPVHRTQKSCGNNNRKGRNTNVFIPLWTEPTPQISLSSRHLSMVRESWTSWPVCPAYEHLAQASEKWQCSDGGLDWIRVLWAPDKNVWRWNPLVRDTRLMFPWREPGGAPWPGLEGTHPGCEGWRTPPMRWYPFLTKIIR